MHFRDVAARIFLLEEVKLEMQEMENILWHMWVGGFVTKTLSGYRRLPARTTTPETLEAGGSERVGVRDQKDTI